MQEDILTLLLIIWSQALAYCFHFLLVGVVIIMTSRASAPESGLGADEKPENKFYTKFHTDISNFFLNIRILGVFVVLPGGKFAD